jgi:Bacterial regulatory proteins, gntR family
VALTDEAIEKISQMIVTGRVRPGEKLPREQTQASPDQATTTAETPYRTLAITGRCR